MRPSWSSSVVLGEGMWDSGGCDASYPLTPVSPFASLREEVPLGSLAVSSRGSGVSPLPLRRSLWSEFRVFCGHQRRQRAAHSHSDRSSSATPLPLGLRATLSSCSCCCLYLREDRREEYEKIAQPGGRAWAEHRAGRHRREASREDVEGYEGLILWLHSHRCLHRRIDSHRGVKVGG